MSGATTEPCPRCHGEGRRVYPSSAGWRGGAGGMTITDDVCDKCWGTGDLTNKGRNLRAPYGPLREPAPAVAVPVSPPGAGLPRCETCGADLKFCDEDKYPSGGSVCVGAERREWRAVVAGLRADLAAVRAELKTALACSEEDAEAVTRMQAERDEARALLRRWHNHAVTAHWTDHGTSGLSAETLAAVGGTPFTVQGTGTKGDAT